MKAIVVEDDPYKRHEIVLELQSLIPKVQIDQFASYQTGLKALLNGGYDFAVLDMSMPTYEVGESEPGGRFRPFGGKEILRKLLRRNALLPIIVMTQFGTFGEAGRVVDVTELDRELRKEYPEHYRGYVYFDSTSDDWRRHLGERIDQVIDRLSTPEGETE